MSEPRTAPTDAASPTEPGGDRLAHATPIPAHPGDVLYDFVNTLLARARTQRATLPAGDDADPDAAARLERTASLQLAEAALRLHLSHDPTRPRPTQIAVIGPTQVGKSTVVNLLVGAEAATVSPLAGFTTHAQAFATGTRPLDAAQALPAHMFPNWARVPRAALLHDQLEAFAFEFVPRRDECTAVPAGSLFGPRQEDVVSAPAPGPAMVFAPVAAPAPPRVVWDTPDFDSLAARFYQRAVLEVAAAADVFVLVVSKEKYADLSVWQTLRLLAPLDRPLVVVLNKLAPESDAIVRAALTARLREFGGRWAAAPITPLAYCPAVARPQASAERDAWIHAGRAVLEQAVTAARPTARDRPGVARDDVPVLARGAGVAALLKTHWASWTAPLEAEHAAAREFQAVVGRSAEQILAEYRRDYLDHPQRYDAFRRASVELLQLLELPGLGGALTQVRHVVTWPARQLVRAGRTLLERSRARPGDGARSGALTPSSGALVLQAAADAQLVALERMLLLRCDERGPTEPWWRAVRQRLDAQRDEIRATVRSACESLEVTLRAEIQAAARELFDLLLQRPALLHTLRAARVTADVAGIALAIKTGGAGLHDLLYAPAMLAFSSLLTEGALGSYMEQVADNLKKRQFAATRRTLIDQHWRPHLARVADALSAPGIIGIDEIRLAQARQALAEFAHLGARAAESKHGGHELGGAP